jgi:hypothetical protein
VITTPPTAHPIGVGTPATTFRIQPRPISCEARMKSEPIQSSSEITPRTAAL